MSEKKMVAAVQFPPCGAEFHPAFSNAILQGNGTYLILFPVKVQGILKSATAQQRWAEDKARHIRSWGMQATILSIPV